MTSEPGLDPWKERFNQALDAGDEAFVADKLNAWSAAGAVQEHAYDTFYDLLSAITCARYPHLARHRAHKALERECITEALDWLETARSVLDPLDETSALDLAIDEALILREDGRWIESIALLDQVEGAARLMDRQRLRIANMRAVIAISSQHDYSLATRLFDSIVDLSQRQSDKTSLLTALINRALSVHRFGGQFDRMLEAANEVERIYRGDVPAVDRIYLARIRARASVEACLADSAATVQAYLNEASTSPWARGDALVFDAFDRLNRGEAEGVIDLLREVEVQVTPSSVDLMLATCARLRSEAMEIGRITSPTLDLFERRLHGEPFWRCWALSELAHAFLIIGDKQQVESKALMALTLAETHGFAFERFICCVFLAACSGSPKRCRRAIELMVEGNFDEVLLSRFRTVAEIVLQGSLSVNSDPQREIEILNRMGSHSIRVCVFGGLAVWVGSRRVGEKEWVRPRSRALFAYLVLRYAVSPTCDEAAAALWPDLSEKMARQSLQNALTHLRKALGTDIVDTNLNVIRLRPDLWIDLKFALTARVGDSSLRDIAHQPLLPEYAYDDWFADLQLEIEPALTNLISG